MSGGQQQRVAIARALVYEPPVILLDEPLSNLDAKLREEARAWVRTLIVTLGLSAIHVTHDQVEAMAIADRMMLLDGGMIAQEGTPTALYNEPATQFAAEFMGSNNRLDGTLGGECRRPGHHRSVRRAHHRPARTKAASAAKLTASPGSNACDCASSAGPNRLKMELKAPMYLGERWELVFTRENLTVRAYAAAPLQPGEHYVEFPPTRCGCFDRWLDFHGVFPYLVSPIDAQGRIKTDVLGKLVVRSDQGRRARTDAARLDRRVRLSQSRAARHRGAAHHRSGEQKGAGDRGRRVDIDGRRGRAGQGLSEARRRRHSRHLEAYFPLKDAQVEIYFRAIADAVDIPVVLYTNPNFQRSDLTLDVIARLSEHPRIRYIKDASTNTGRLLSIMNRAPTHESVLGLGAYSGGGDADRRRRLDGGARQYRAAPEREAVRSVPRREMAGGDERCSVSCGASTRPSRASISPPASRPACRSRATPSAIRCRRRPRSAPRPQGSRGHLAALRTSAHGCP